MSEPATTTATTATTDTTTTDAATTATTTTPAETHPLAPKATTGTTDAPPADIDLAKTSDEDYAKLVQPDVEGEEVDRSLITPMAKELREAGIQPHVMAKIAAIYGRAVDAKLAEDAAERARRMKELDARCLAEVTDEEKRDFAAAYSDVIAKNETLKHLVDTTELGRDPAFVKLIALAGATLRVETPPPASAAAGSSQTDLERAVFEATVPKDLR